MKNTNKKQHQTVMEVLKKHEKRLKKFKGVQDVALGFTVSKGQINFDELGIQVFVDKKKSKKSLAKKEQLPTELDGVRVDVIESKPTEKSSLADAMEGIINPLKGGINIGNAKFNTYGTLGIVLKQKTSGELMALTNHHVVKRRKGRRGNVIVQPAFRERSSRFVIGNLHRWSKKLDCASIKLNNNRSATIGEIQYFDKKIKTTQSPFIGMAVKKSGVKTGVTFGIIASITSNLRKIRIVANPQKPADNNEISDSGDSGAVWVTDEVNAKAVALHWGGDKAETRDSEFALANNMLDVKNCLELEF